MSFKKVLSIILVLMFAVFLVSCGESTEDEDFGSDLTVEEKINNSELLYPSYNENFKYDVYTYYIKIREYIGNGSEIIVPDTIENRTVLAIEDQAFYKDYENEEYKGPKITKVILPKTLIKIGAEAFLESKYLKEIKFPNSIQTIGDSAFSGCLSLTKITIPKSVSYIGVDAFNGCINLTSVTIEEQLKAEELEGVSAQENVEGGRTIENGAFINCPNLKAIWVPADITYVEDGALDDKEYAPNLEIFGYGQSRIAYYASTNLLKFTVLDKDKFDVLANKLIQQNTTVPIESSTSISTDTSQNTSNIVKN